MFLAVSHAETNPNNRLLIRVSDFLNEQVNAICSESLLRSRDNKTRWLFLFFSIKSQVFLFWFGNKKKTREKRLLLFIIRLENARC